MTKVKICGITNIEDAVLAVYLGADSLGFNFYRQSPRFFEPTNAREIAEKLPGDVLKVGVFVNEPIEAIARISELAGINAVQLHGDESLQFVREIRSITGLSIIKALRVTPDFRPDDAVEYDADAILLDSYSDKGLGGTGESFDWSIAKRVRTLVGALYLAGGLTADNVATAISEVHPYSIDVCSSIESKPGKKDPEKLRAFFDACRNSS